MAYLNDHQPTAATAATEDRLIGGAQLALVDANYVDAADQAFGHK